MAGVALEGEALSLKACMKGDDLGYHYGYRVPKAREAKFATVGGACWDRVGVGSSPSAYAWAVRRVAYALCAHLGPGAREFLDDGPCSVQRRESGGEWQSFFVHSSAATRVDFRG